MKLLLVDDDEPTADLLGKTLTAHGYAIDVASDGQSGLELALSLSYDLILLDICIPRLDGISFCQRLRTQGYEKAILLLTAKDSTSDIVAGLDAGADDYVTKPYKVPELLARIRALLRRRPTTLAPMFLTWGELNLNPISAEVTYGERLIPLTSKEFSLLELFLSNPQRVFNRAAIIDRLWSLAASPGEATVTNLIKNLRQKLKTAGLEEDVFETIYGMGYRLKPAPELKQEPKVEGVVGSPESLSSRPSPSPEKLAAVEQVLEGLKIKLSDRLMPLEHQEQILQTTGPTSELLQQMAQEAHKLIGSLGMLGYERGSELAREIEHLLSHKTTVTLAERQRVSGWVTELRQEVLRSAPSGPLETALSGGWLSPVLIIGEEAPWIEQMRQEGKPWGFRIEVVDPAIAPQRLAQPLPDLLLFHLSAADPSGMNLLQGILAQFPQLPVLVLTDHESLDHRVMLSRLGVRRYLHKPTVSPTQILATMTQTLAQYTITPDRVLAVDDDPIVLVSLRNILRPWGLEVTTLQDPAQFWKVLTTTRPDLLLLDLEMPTFSGIDLCQVVRQDPQWGDLPILVVTSHTDTDSLHRVFAAGADDFIRKPVFEPELITRVMSRINRTKLELKSEVSQPLP